MVAAANNPLGRLGNYVLGTGRQLRHLAAVTGAVMLAAVQPRHWPRTVRNVFARQLYFSGVSALRFVLLVAVLVGVTVVVETYQWLDRTGLSQNTGGLLVVIVARELGPLFVSIILIVRSGSAIASEMGVMKITGEVRALEAQGIEPFIYLLMPRVLAMALASFCLTAVFNVAAFASGYGFGAYIQAIPDAPKVFLDTVFASIDAADALAIVAKCLIPAALAGVICVTEGLNASASLTDVPRVTRRALSRAVAAVFITFVVISLLTYG